MPAKKKVNKENFFLRMRPVHKILMSLILSTIAYFIVSSTTPNLIRILLFWDVFSLSYLTLCWIVILKRSVPQIRQLAKLDDGSATFVFLLILISSFASMFIVLLLLLSQKNTSATNDLYLPVAVPGMLFSWLMVHSIYTFHYAHMYYDDDKDNPEKDAHGLDFPGNSEVNYVDFAYFSFVIGCTFQVSDVEISSPKIRRVVLVHGLLSFGLNTFVVALTINLIAGLAK